MVFLLVLVMAIGLFLFTQDKAVAPNNHTNSSTAVTKPPKPMANGFIVFTGAEFAKLYDGFAYPNTQTINEQSPITGNEEADTRIRELAVARGYKLRSAPVTDNFVEVQKNMVLQQKAAQPYLDLKNSARNAGILLSLGDAYRSADDQRTIFLDRIKGIPLGSITARTADIQVNTVLEKTALPGYSRHHTGYTIDLICDSQPGVKFEKSICFTWLSKDNYLNAKSYGWIPSYPEGTSNQGPEPESWEYVWVGLDALK